MLEDLKTPVTFLVQHFQSGSYLRLVNVARKGLRMLEIVEIPVFSVFLNV